MERDQLAHEQRLERRLGFPARAEDALLGADEADREPVAGELCTLGEELGVGRRVGDHAIGCAKRAPVDRRERTPGERTGREAPPVVDEGVEERDERVEDDRPAAGRIPRGCQVEVPRVADDERVELMYRPPEQAHLGEREPGRRHGACAPFVGASFPDRDMPLEHADAGAAKSRDHLRVAGIVALVRAEVEDAHRGRVGSCSARSVCSRA